MSEKVTEVMRDEPCLSEVMRDEPCLSEVMRDEPCLFGRPELDQNFLSFLIDIKNVSNYLNSILSVF
jgi:hypothetical protein